MAGGDQDNEIVSRRMIAHQNLNYKCKVHIGIQCRYANKKM